jgi:hypothetical protein
MSANDALLTCAETPLAWPASVDLGDVKVSRTSALQMFSPAAGSLQILTRRQEAGDGVNIEESPTVGADFRGQRYSLEEVIFHAPGLHVFPGQTSVYPAELHIHMRTFSAPQRGVTVVVPVSHLVDPSQPGQAYFAACAAQPDPAAQRPVLTSLLPQGVPLLIYRGPDIRGRTADVPTTDQCAPDAAKRDFVLVLDVAFIRATDLERIPREGSLSTDPRDLPAPGVAPTEKLLRDRVLRTMTLARPGLAATVRDASGAPAPPVTELQCNPVSVVNGRDVVSVGGKPLDLAKLLGFDVSGGPASGEAASTGVNSALVKGTLMFFGTMIGILIADAIINYIVWETCFISSKELALWEPLKVWIYLSIALGAAGLGGSNFTLDTVGGWFSGSNN